MGWPGPMTHRQFRTWEMWWALDLNVPGKVEQYLMQIAAEVRRGHVKEPKKVDMRNFRLKFNDLDTTVAPQQEEELQLAKWTGMVGGSIRVIPPEEVWIYEQEAAERLAAKRAAKDQIGES